MIIFSGSAEGQFKFPRGVAVDENGFIIVGDSGNNRIQVFNPDGTFLKVGHFNSFLFCIYTNFYNFVGIRSMGQWRRRI